MAAQNKHKNFPTQAIRNGRIRPLRDYLSRIRPILDSLSRIRTLRHKERSQNWNTGSQSGRRLNEGLPGHANCSHLTPQVVPVEYVQRLECIPHKNQFYMHIKIPDATLPDRATTTRLPCSWHMNGRWHHFTYCPLARHAYAQGCIQQAIFRMLCPAI